MAGALCSKCGHILDQFLIDQGLEQHVGCEPHKRSEDTTPVTGPVVFGGEQHREAEQLRKDLTEIILWADRNSTRSQQKAIGPSEMGDECDRFIAYRLSGLPEVNFNIDPWPAIVGTAIHNWLERAVQKFQEAAGGVRFSTEATVHPDPLIEGHMDLFDHWMFTVIDLKTLGTAKQKQWIKSGPPENNKKQINLYARGVLATGREVRKVALVGVPRSGWLKDMQVWMDDYRPELAQAALDRVYRIAELMDVLRVLDNPHQFSAIPHVADMCTFCPFFRPTNREGTVADENGCPGR